MKARREEVEEAATEGFGEVVWADPDDSWEKDALVWWTSEFSWLKGLWRLEPGGEKRWEGWAPPPRVRAMNGNGG